MKKPFSSFFAAALERKQEVAIMYFGRTSDALVMTSERMAIAGGNCTLGQLLERLRQRGGRWTEELDESHVVCAVNGKAAVWHDTIRAGSEIEISSRKSSFEA